MCRSLPPELGLLDAMQDLDLEYNNLRGSIPAALTNMRVLVHLRLYTCIATSTPVTGIVLHASSRI